MYWQENNRGGAHESTWFSKERMTGKGEVLKAHSAMASTTSWKISNIAQHHLQEASSKAKFTFQNAAAYCLKCRLYMRLQRVPIPWRRFLMSWWTRVWWRVPPRRFVLSKHLIPRSGSQPGEPVCTSLPRSSLPAGPLKQPRNRYKTHWTTFHLLLPLTGNSFHPLSSVRSSNLSHSRSCVTAPACAYLSGMCYGMSWWSSVTGGNSYLRTGPASLVGWLRSRRWKDNWKNPGGWWCLHRNINMLNFDSNIWLHIYKQECLEASAFCRFLTGPSTLWPLLHQPLAAVRRLLLLFFNHCIKNVIKSSYSELLPLKKTISAPLNSLQSWKPSMLKLFERYCFQ